MDDIKNSEAKEFPRFNHIPPSKKHKKSRFEPSKKMRGTHSFIIRQIEATGISTPNATAFNKGDSSIRNAQMHAENRFVYTLDLHDAFSSVDPIKMMEIIEATSFSRLPTTNHEWIERDWYDNRFRSKHPERQCSLTILKRAIVLHCFHCTPEVLSHFRYSKPPEAMLPEGFSGLVRGGPASPCLFNLYCEYLIDAPLTDVLNKHLGERNFVFTRYGDDITVSSNQWISLLIRREIRKILFEAGFSINDRKARYYDRKNKKSNVVITGCSQRPSGRGNVSKRYRNHLKGLIYRARIDHSISKWEVRGKAMYFQMSFDGPPNQSDRKILDRYRVLSQLRNIP